jgi:subtilisin family serine protease
MKNKKYLLIIGFVIAVILSAIQIIPSTEAAGDNGTHRKIVVFKNSLSDIEKDRVINESGAEKVRHLKSARSSVVVLNNKEEWELVKNLDVLRVDDDIVINAFDRNITSKGGGTVIQPAEVLPWGVDRINAEVVWGGVEDATNVVSGNNAGAGIKVAVIDTGIELAHPDLAANIKGGYNAISPLKSANDDNGHGTHVAGIIGAIDNAVGVLGVGPKIDLYAVKVLNRSGSGYLSDIIEGLDWAIANKMQVVNMSLGTSVYNKSFEDAIKRVDAAGIVQVAAAGNSGPNDNTVDYPGKFAEVIAVSAVDKNDAIASFSSRGPEVDLASPGVSIFSTYKGKTYKNLSGTSMASPHVAGVAALLLNAPAKCDLNNDNICSPAEVKQRLEISAEDLGAVGRDNLYGAGLVNAERTINL